MIHVVELDKWKLPFYTKKLKDADFKIEHRVHLKSNAHTLRVWCEPPELPQLTAVLKEAQYLARISKN